MPKTVASEGLSAAGYVKIGRCYVRTDKNSKSSENQTCCFGWPPVGGWYSVLNIMRGRQHSRCLPLDYTILQVDRVPFTLQTPTYFPM